MKYLPYLENVGITIGISIAPTAPRGPRGTARAHPSTLPVENADHAVENAV